MACGQLDRGAVLGDQVRALAVHARGRHAGDDAGAEASRGARYRDDQTGVIDELAIPVHRGTGETGAVQAWHEALRIGCADRPWSRQHPARRTRCGAQQVGGA